MSLSEPDNGRLRRAALFIAMAVTGAVILADAFLVGGEPVDLSSPYGLGVVVGFSLGAGIFVGGIAYMVLHFTALRGDNRRHRPAYAAMTLSWCFLVAASAFSFMQVRSGPVPVAGASDPAADAKPPG